MDYRILKEPGEVREYVQEVKTIADGNKNAFGFLKSPAYEQKASKGQLWVAVNSTGELEGYLIIGGRGSTLSVSQIYAVKGQGVGRLLIDALKEYAKEGQYHYISAKVAADLPANGFWDRMGFPVYQQVKGGKTTNRIINIRAYLLSGNDLFGDSAKDLDDIEPSDRPVFHDSVYALDVNLLFDIVKKRSGFKKSVRNIQDGLRWRLTVCFTPEFKKELERHSANHPDDVTLRVAHMFPELISNGGAADIAESLRETIFPDREPGRKSAQNDQSDLMHLAYCISAGIDGFITRDKELLKSCNEVREKHDVSIYSPDDLVSDDELPYVMAPLNADFTFSKSSATRKVKDFLKHLEAPKTVTDMLNNLSSDGSLVDIYTASLDRDLFGVYIYQAPIRDATNAVAALYIDEDCTSSRAAIDHFLETALRHKNDFSCRLDMYIGQKQNLTRETLIKKGFFKRGDYFVKIIISQFLNSSNWKRFSEDIKRVFSFSTMDKFPSIDELINTGILFTDKNNNIQTFSQFEFETAIGPRFILNPNRGCVLVPIRKEYAKDLIGNITGQYSLFSSHEKSLLLEKAYFRSLPRNDYFTRGGIIAFYVSEGVQQLIGFARITYSDVVGIDEAKIRTDRQGVLSHEELADIADKNGEMHVFTFDNFLEFDHRVPYSRAKDMGLISDANLAAPEKINAKQLKTLIGEAFNEQRNHFNQAETC